MIVLSGTVAILFMGASLLLWGAEILGKIIKYFEVRSAQGGAPNDRSPRADGPRLGPVAQQRRDASRSPFAAASSHIAVRESERAEDRQL